MPESEAAAPGAAGGPLARRSAPRARRLLILLLVVASLWAAAFVLASAAAPALARAALPKVQARLAALGIVLGEVSYARLRVSPWLTRLRLSDLSARLDLNPRNQVELRTQLDLATLEVRLGNPFGWRGSVRATGREFRLHPSDLPRQLPFDRFANFDVTIGDLPLGDPRQAATAIRDKLMALFLENQATGEVAFSAEVIVVVDDVERVARLYTERSGGSFSLRFRADDIRALAQAKDLGLVAEQIEIVAHYPLRAPALLLLTDQARALSMQYAPADAWLRDAMRHVIWSFLLARTFGPDFATTVTDAQELRPGNTPDERAMDFHNNAVGRRLVAENVPLAAVPERVRSDPDIIRHPDEVARFGAQRLLR